MRASVHLGCWWYDRGLTHLHPTIHASGVSKIGINFYYGKKWWRRVTIGGLLVLVALGVSGCQWRHPVAPEHRSIQVVCTTEMVADAVRQIVGDRATVTVLMLPTQNPHTYTLTPSDSIRLRSADVVVINGLNLEHGMSIEMLNQLGKSVYVINLADAIPAKDRILFYGDVDPHFGMDVVLWKKIIHQLMSDFSKYDRKNRFYYVARESAYQLKLDVLDRYIRDQISKIIPLHKILIASHDGYQYFGRRYGFQVYHVPLETNTTAIDPAILQAANIIRKHQIQAIFMDPSGSEAQLMTIQKIVEKSGGQVRMGGPILSDSTNGGGGNGSTYINLLRANVDTIANGLMGFE